MVFSILLGNEQNTCVAMSTTIPVGLWENKACTEHHHYICEFARTGFTTQAYTTAVSNAPCPTGWSGPSNRSPYCYKVHTNDDCDLDFLIVILLLIPLSGCQVLHVHRTWYPRDTLTPIMV